MSIANLPVPKPFIKTRLNDLDQVITEPNLTVSIKQFRSCWKWEVILDQVTISHDEAQSRPECEQNILDTLKHMGMSQSGQARIKRQIQADGAYRAEFNMGGNVSLSYFVGKPA